MEREHEEERYREKYGSMPNKRLLWHGSRLTNFVGILSQVRLSLFFGVTFLISASQNEILKCSFDS